MTLHLIQKSPFTHSALKDCLDFIDSNDIILLMQDGALACQHSLLQNIEHATYVLSDDLSARSLQIRGNIQAIDYKDFVDLCASSTRVISWY
ncbi:MAG: sulfurtransferase complex subunit TusB [Bermanella sp.]